MRSLIRLLSVLPLRTNGAGSQLTTHPSASCPPIYPAAYLVWPRRITVAIPGTGYTIREPTSAGVLYARLIGVNGQLSADKERVSAPVSADGTSPPSEQPFTRLRLGAEAVAQVRWAQQGEAADTAANAAAGGRLPVGTRSAPPAALKPGGALALPVDDPGKQLLWIAVYDRVAESGAAVYGEASVPLSSLINGALRCAFCAITIVPLCPAFPSAFSTLCSAPPFALARCSVGGEKWRNRFISPSPGCRCRLFSSYPSPPTGESVEVIADLAPPTDPALSAAMSADFRSVSKPNRGALGWAQDAGGAVVNWGGYVVSGIGSGASSLAKGTSGAWGAVSRTLSKEGWKGVAKIPGSVSQGYVSAVWGDGQSADSTPGGKPPSQPHSDAASAAAGAGAGSNKKAGSLILELRYETAAPVEGDQGVGWAILTAENASHALQARIRRLVFVFALFVRFLCPLTPALIAWTDTLLYYSASPLCDENVMLIRSRLLPTRASPPEPIQAVHPLVTPQPALPPPPPAQAAPAHTASQQHQQPARAGGAASHAVDSVAAAGVEAGAFSSPSSAAAYASAALDDRRASGAAAAAPSQAHARNGNGNSSHGNGNGSGSGSAGWRVAPDASSAAAAAPTEDARARAARKLRRLQLAAGAAAAALHGTSPSSSSPLSASLSPEKRAQLESMLRHADELVGRAAVELSELEEALERAGGGAGGQKGGNGAR